MNRTMAMIGGVTIAATLAVALFIGTIGLLNAVVSCAAKAPGSTLDLKGDKL